MIQHHKKKVIRPVSAASNELTFGMFITKSPFPHVTQPDASLTAAVDKHVTFLGVKLCSRDDFCQLLHVGWFDVNNIFTSVKNNVNQRLGVPGKKEKCQPGLGVPGKTRTMSTSSWVYQEKQPFHALLGIVMLTSTFL